MTLVMLNTQIAMPAGLSLKAIDTQGRRRQPLLWGSALVLLALMVPTYAAYLLDARLLNGVNVWTKPLKFEFSIAVFFATLAWFWGYVPEARRGRWLGASAIVAAGAATFEIAYIIVQAARGVHSHFNETTAFEAAMFQAMGVGAVLMTATALVLAIALIRAPRGDMTPAFRLSVILGLILTFVLGTGAGIAIAENGGHWVGAVGSDAGGLPIFGWSRTGGDLRVGHFLGIHALQILPLIGLAAGGDQRGGRVIVWLAAAGFAMVTIATTVQAMAGRPFLGFVG